MDIFIAVVVEFIGLIAVVAIIDVPWIGRKNAMRVNIALALLFLVFCCFTPINNWFVVWVCIVKAANCASFNLLYIYSAEFYPTKIRGIGIGMAAANARIAGILTTSCSTLLSDLFVHLPYIIFTCVDAFGFVAVLLLDLETLNRSLDTAYVKKWFNF